MRPFVLALCSLVLAGCLSADVLPREGAPLQRSIDSLLDAPPFKGALWAIRVEDERGGVVYALNDNVLAPVASVRKLFTAIAVADCSDLWSPILTEFLIDGEVADGVLKGSLYVRGNGDPALAGRHDPARELSFAQLLAELRRRGIRRVAGDVVADGSRYEPLRYPPGWKRSSIGSSYAAPVSALAFNENAAGVFVRRATCPPDVYADPSFLETTDRVACASSTAIRAAAQPANRIAVSGTIGPAGAEQVVLISISDPDLYTAEGVRDLLDRHGINVAGGARTGRTATSARRIALSNALTRFELLFVTLAHSQNTYAEMLLKNVSDDAVKSWRDALDRERDVLVARGIGRAEFRFFDGSGLSAENAATPRSVVSVMRLMAREESVWRPLLAQPGAEGTLRRRLTELEGRVAAKTGSIDRVNALAGWIDGVGGRRRYFSIVVANHSASSRQGSERIDAVVRLLAKF